MIDKTIFDNYAAAQEFYTEQRLLANVESEYTAQTFTPNTANFLQEDIKKAFEKVSGRVGIDNLSGFDPAGLASRYRNCEDTIRNVAESEWENMSPEERKKYDSKGKSAWDNYLTRRTQAEMRTRNKEWLENGIKGKTTYDANAHPLPKEKQVADWLNNLGFDVHFRETRSLERKKTSDILVGGENGVPWEIKQPQGSGKWNISNQFNEATGQSEKLILDISQSPLKADYIEEEAQTQLHHRKDFNEVLIIQENYLRRVKK